LFYAGAQPATGGARARVLAAEDPLPLGRDEPRRLLYFVRRSAGDRVVAPSSTSSTKCSRCLWNVEALAAALASAMPRTLVVLANPGELGFAQQYGLFRAAHVLLGLHGSAFAWGTFLTPSQAIVEMPLPGSPGLNDWLFASVGARTACVQACDLAAPVGRGCTSKGGDADIQLILRSTRALVRNNRTRGVNGLIWHKLGWRPPGVCTPFSASSGKPLRTQPMLRTGALHNGRLSRGLGAEPHRDDSQADITWRCDAAQ
jgi:hypothetical protein